MSDDNQTISAEPGFKFSLSSLSHWIALLVPFFYLSGYTYRMGWLNGLGLEESLAPLGVDGYIRSGYFSLIAMGGDFVKSLTPSVWFQWLLVCIGVVVLLSLYFTVIYVTRHWIARVATWLDDKRRRATAVTQHTTIIAFMTFLLGSIPAVIIFLFYLLLIPALLPYRQGEADAKKTWGSVQMTNSRYPTALVSSSAVNLQLIECEGEDCVVFDGARFVIVPRDSIQQIVGNLRAR